MTMVVKVGDGGDGSSLLGEGAGRVGTCLTCHPSGSYSKTSIHHDTTDAIAAQTNACTSCHTGSHAGDHQSQSLVTDTALCANCHDATAPTTADNVPVDATPGNKVHDYCTSCHNNPSNDIIVLITPPSANNYVPTTMDPGTAATNDGGGACIECHTTQFDVHTRDHTATVIVNTGNTSNTENCIGCHTGATAGSGPFTSSVHSPSGCFTCHDSGTGALKGSASTADINGIATDAAYECGECHAAYFDGHTIHTATTGHDVSFNATPDQTLAGTPCDNCHTPVSNWTEIASLHNFAGCATCHNYDGTNGEFDNTPSGTVESVILASGSPTCADCHTNKAGADHGAIDHTTYDGGAGAGVVKGEDDGLIGTNCVTCHDTGGLASDAHYIGTIHDASGRGCGTCHNSAGGAGSLVSYDTPYSTASGSNSLPSLIGETKDYEAINENGGFCSDCHNVYQTAGNHKVKDHDQLGNETSCNFCHTETLGEDIRTVIHSGIGCGVCHDTAAGYIMKAGSSAANHTYGSTDSCTGCHTGASSEFDGTTLVHFNGGTETHASMLTGAANCTTDCHSGDIQTAVHAPNGGCQNCHNSAADGTLINSTYGDASGHTKGLASSCTDCHSKAGTDYSADYTVHTADTHSTNLITTGAAKCTDCHGTGNVQTGIHTSQCGLCHTVTGGNGSFKVGSSAENHTTGSQSTCLTCHTTLDSNFADASHLTGNTHASMVTGSAKCTGCHNGADIIVDVHNNNCENCHIDTTLPTTDGRFSDGTGASSKDGSTSHGTAQGHVIGVAQTCINCHSAYDTDFDGSHTGETHGELTTAGANQCTDCHGTGDIITSTSIHNSNCEACHTDVTPAGGEDGTLKGSALNHAMGGPSGCATCHTVIAGDFDNASHLTNDSHDAMLANYNSATPSQDCDNCHTAANGTAVRDIIHSTNTCDNCHVGLTTDGRLKLGDNYVGARGDARLHTIGQQSTCITCHGVNYFLSHDYGNAHLGVSYDGGTNDTSQAAPNTKGCGVSECHNDYGNNLADWAAIEDEHKACINCHDYDGSGVTDGSATTAAISNGSGGGNNETCADCHIDKVPDTDHGGHSDSQFAPEALCTSCHNGGASVVGVVHDNCGICHLSSGGAGTKIGSAVGKTLGTARTCSYCHTAITDQATKVSFHHSTDKAVLGQCQECHTNARLDTGVAPKQLNCVKCHINDTGSALQIVGYDLTLADGSEPVDTQTGAVAGHTITYGAGPATEIYDFRACFDCHSGQNTNYPSAQVVKPFHGYPGDWTVGHLVNGAGQLPGLGQTAPSAYSNGLNDLADADEVPYFYQWWHPGPGIARGNGIRRFNSVMAYRMGSNSRQVYKGYDAITLTGTNPNLVLEAAGKGDNYTFDLGNGESVTGGLQTAANQGVTYQNQGYSQSFNVPYTSAYFGDNSGTYTTVPSHADITGGDVLTVTKADWDGTNLTVWVTNSLNNGSTISLTYTGDGSCNGNMNWSSGNQQHELTCTTASFTGGTDEITVSSNASSSIDVTVKVNDNQGGETPTADVVTITSATWLNDGDGAASGDLTVYATHTDGDGGCGYDLDYNGGATATMSWNGIQSRYEGTIAANFDGAADQVIISSIEANCDASTTGTASNNSDTLTDILGPGSGNTRAFYDPASSGTLTVWATHSYADGSLTYYANYNSTDYLMSWVGGSSRYEATPTGVGAYSANVTVHSAESGGDSLTANDVEAAVADDIVTINSQNWRTNGDGSATGQIAVCFSHSNNDGVCDYDLDYSDGTTVTNVGWNTQVNCGANEYEGVMSNVTWNSTPNNVVISSGTGGCDTSTTATAVDTSDTVTMTQADHDGANLTVTANLTNDGTCPRNYVVTYESTTSGNMACATNTPSAGQSQYTITWSGTPAFNGGSATVHSAAAYGDSASLSVTDTAVAGGNLLPTHTAHEASGYVKWGSNPYSVAGEGCFNCHGPDDGSIDTVMDVHSGKCNLCHQSAAPVGPDLITGAMRNKDVNQDGNATNDTIAAGTCSSCHYAFMSQKTGTDLRYKTWNHHLSENAQSGNCVHCHHSVRTTAVGQSWCSVAGSRVPRQPPCAYCHVDGEKAYGGTGDGSWQLQFFNFTDDGFNTPLTKMTSTTHSIPNIDGSTSSPIVVHDFAVCFECHDTTDMMDSMVDGNSVSILGPAAVPNKVYPYHASGMLLDTSAVPVGTSDPGGNTNFPLVRNSGYDPTDEATADSNSDPVFDDVNWGPGVSDDMFFAYYYHPGRGGIVGTSNVIESGGHPVGSFNTLFPFMTQHNGANAKYYQAGDSEGGPQIKWAYKDAGTGYNANHNGYNYGDGGTQTATPYSNYTDSYGKNWNFSLTHNVPYTDYVIPATNGSDNHWSTVPVFSDIAAPTVIDDVRLLTVDCSGQTVTARSHLTGDYNLNQTPATGDLQITSPETVDMTYDAGTDTWTGTLSAVCSSTTVTVTSNISGGGSASFTVP